LDLKEQYGLADIGLLFIFFFNIMRLKRDEAVVITPNEPHAYISGDLVECMANSDNVVRGGLTPKLKDKETLYEMLPYHTLGMDRQPVKGKPLLQSDTCEALEYKTGFEEFRVFKVEVKQTGSGSELKLKFKTFSMAVVINGTGHVHMPNFSEDEALNKFKISKDNAYYIMPDQEFSIINDNSD
jgi:mannose-6-phosphate isomerase